MFAIPGLVDLERGSAGWDSVDFIDWLRAGFAAIGRDKPADIRSAFRPLVLQPDRDPGSQLAMALREASGAGLACAGNLIQAARAYLDDPEVVSEEDASFMARLWHLLGAIGLPADAAAGARSFVEFARLRRDLDDGALARLVAAVAAAVAAATPPSAIQLSFFRFLKGDPALWHPRFIASVIDLSFAKAELERRQGVLGASVPAEVWGDIVGQYREDIERAADPSAPAGRALLRSLDRRLGEFRLQNAEDRTDFELFRDRLADEGAGTAPVITFTEPKQLRDIPAVAQALELA